MMAKKYNYKFSKEQNRTINNAVRRFNRKLERLAKNPKYGGVILPDRATVSGLKNRVNNKRDIQRELNRLDRLMKKGAERIVLTETGLFITAYERKEVAIQLRAVNARMTRLRNIANKTKDKRTGMERGLMYGTENPEFRKRINKLDQARNKKELRLFTNEVFNLSNLNYEKERMEKYKRNYIKGIKNEMGKYAKELIQYVKSIPAKDLVDMYYQDPDMSLQFLYDPSEQSAKYNYMKSRFQEYFENIKINDLFC